MFILGNIPVKRSKKKPVKKTNNETKFMYNIMLGEYDRGFKTRQILSEYSAARNVALKMIQRKNKLLTKKTETLSCSGIEYFTEISPDCWTNGNEFIRIKVSEIKYS
jgi:hypothetical protein